MKTLFLNSLLIMTAFHYSAQAQTEAKVPTINRGIATYLDGGGLDGYDDAAPETRQELRKYKTSKSLFHVAPTVGYLNTSWKGVSATAPSYYTSGTGGTMTAQDGVGAGVTVIVGSDQLQFESGLQYAQRNAHYSGFLKDVNGNAISYTGNIDISASYLEVPVMARFSFSDPSSSHFFVHGGAVAAFLVSNSNSVTNTNYGYQTGYFYPSYYSGTAGSASGTLGTMNSTDFRGVAGLGGEIKLDKGLFLTIEADYQRSISEISNSRDYNIAIESFGGSVGISFDL